MEVIDNAIGKTAGATKELVSSRAFVCPGTQSELTGKLNRPGVMVTQSRTAHLLADTTCSVRLETGNHRAFLLVMLGRNVNNATTQITIRTCKTLSRFLVTRPGASCCFNQGKSMSGVSLGDQFAGGLPATLGVDREVQVTTLEIESSRSVGERPSNFEGNGYRMADQFLEELSIEACDCSVLNLHSFPPFQVANPHPIFGSSCSSDQPTNAISPGGAEQFLRQPVARRDGRDRYDRNLQLGKMIVAQESLASHRR
nr:hypothetical protein Iba_chr14fCG7890 [Ipomoea batatas]